MGRENQATIKDVAKRAGVSVASAGRALGNYGKISDETKQKVLAAAEELHYIPNKLAQSMRSHSTKTIAVVVAGFQTGGWNFACIDVYRSKRDTDKIREDGV